MPARSKKRKRSPTPSARAGAPIAYLVGESPLVEEYADLCSGKGYSVFVYWNDGATPLAATKNQLYRKSAIVPANASVALELTNTDIEAKIRNVQKLDRALGPQIALLSSSITISATEQATHVRHKHRLVGFGALPGFSNSSLVELAPTVHTPLETINVARTFFRSIGKEIELVQDRVGMVFPRILCQIINEATFALMEDIASPKDIDIAMRLGVNYPYGPIEWAERIGIRQVYSVLSALERDLKEDRYRVSPLLKQMAAGGEWWRSNEA